METTRTELYLLVSATPLSKVAPQFGISATALAALCKKHDVPCPGSGHWTRKLLGLPVALQPLPANEDEVIEIPLPKRRLTTPKAAPTKTKPSNGEHVDERSTISAEPIVKQRLSKPHPIVAEWLGSHEKRRREALSNRGPYRSAYIPSPWSELDRRRHRLLDAVFKALETRGGAVSDVGNGVQRVTIAGQKVDFQIREKMEQSKVLVAEQDRPYYSRGFRTELIGTGRLVFAIKTYLRSLQRGISREG